MMSPVRAAPGRTTAMTRDRMIRLSYILLPHLATFESLDRLRNLFAMLRGCGYAGVELNLTEPLGIDRHALHRLLTDAGLIVPSFLTGEAYQDGLCLSSPDEAIRARTVRRLTGYLDVAREFGALLVVGLLQGQRRDEPDPDLANRRIVDGLKVVAESARVKGVDVVIEPVNHLQAGFNNSVAGESLSTCPHRRCGSYEHRVPPPGWFLHVTDRTPARSVPPRLPNARLSPMSLLSLEGYR